MAGSLPVWEQPMPTACPVSQGTACHKHTQQWMSPGRERWGSRVGCRSATCTSPARVGMCTRPLETRQLHTRRNIYSFFCINMFPDMQYQFVLAAIGGGLFNTQNFMPVRCASRSSQFAPCPGDVCNPRRCSTAVAQPQTRTRVIFSPFAANTHSLHAAA